MTPQEIKDLLTGDTEFALIDVREQGRFSEAHQLFAVCIPLSRMELLVGDLIPRFETPIIVVSDTEDDFDMRAVEKLARLGYINVDLMEGGITAWANEGYELFSGVNVPSKAFGEFVEHTYDTPRLEAAEVKAMLDEGKDMVIVDSRPFEEYHRMNIPSGIDMPGAELAYRIHDTAPDPETFVIVNCAGRTRSIIGAQSLINAGIPNPVAALKDGTMGWHLAGFDLEHGSTRSAEPPGTDGTEKALAASERVARRFGVEAVSHQTALQWREDHSRTTFFLDVRSPEEFSAGHLPHFSNAPGGQLVQATDEYIGVKNARLVLADDIGVRATMTASWLIQMGWQEVFVLDGGIEPESLVSGTHGSILADVPEAKVTPQELNDSFDTWSIIDLGSSLLHDRQHIPGALWCTRSRLKEAIAALDAPPRILLTSEDARLACLALPEARAVTSVPVDALAGGTNAWIEDGLDTADGFERTVGPLDDVWYKPYEHRGAQEKFMRDYLTWEVALVEQIERDGTTQFKAFD